MTKIETKKIILVFSVLENVFLILLAVGMIAAFGFSDVLSTTNYMAIGYVLITFVVLTTAVGLAKTGYLCFKKFNDTIGKKERSSISQDEARE
jgi:DNA integrity scanning protein DisA with diadenylate cyclase activity